MLVPVRYSSFLNFYPRPPRGGRLFCALFFRWCVKFPSTPSARRATVLPQEPIWHEENFYPRPPRGGRHEKKPRMWGSLNFYPRPPRGGRLLRAVASPVGTLYFYPRPPRGGRLLQEREADKPLGFLSTPSARRATYGRAGGVLLLDLFLSTPSARRATWPSCIKQSSQRDFYPRPPRGGRPLCSCRSAGLPADFYPRPPRGGRRTGVTGAMDFTKISIHALREEGDYYRPTNPQGHQQDFYPRPPRGGRRCPEALPQHHLPISIHALREEGDRGTGSSTYATGQFLSTPSARRATGENPNKLRGDKFLSTPSARRATSG